MALYSSRVRLPSLPGQPPRPITAEPPYTPDDDIIVQQPMPTNGSLWMEKPQIHVHNCPPGLEYLAHIDQLLMHHKYQLVEVFGGCQTKSMFYIKNIHGEKVFQTEEDTDCWTRNCCGKTRPYEMKILDSKENEVMRFHRPLAGQLCCCLCCMQNMEISAPPGRVIGSVKQEWGILHTQYKVRDASGNIVYRVRGPFATAGCFGEHDFKILTPDKETEIGRISREYAEFMKEAFSDEDSFGMCFPKDLDVTSKALLIGACFLIDTMYFEPVQKWK